MSDRQIDLYVGTPGARDIPEIAALARAGLPTFPSLHDEEGWLTHNRYGRGEHIDDNLFLTARDGPDGPIIGFVWADQAMHVDYGIPAPWWCLNALTVHSDYRRLGVGNYLVREVIGAATAVGVELVYGQAAPGSADFWDHLNFRVAQANEPLLSTEPLSIGSGEPSVLSLSTQEEHRWILWYTTPEPKSVTLIPESASKQP